MGTITSPIPVSINPSAGTLPLTRPSRVRYQVLAVACVLAVLTYINRLGFGQAAPEIKGSLGLTDDQMGYLASAFLVAYGICQVPGGLLGDRIGGRHLLTVLVLGWSLLSGATALALFLPAHADLPVILLAVLPAGAALPFLFLMVLRFLFGLFQAAEFPSLARVIADWMPVQERGSAQGMIWTFSRLGGAFVPFLFAAMLSLFGTWTTPFWVMAGLGVLWCCAFWPWFRNKPEEMNTVNAAEREVIESGRNVSAAGQARMPWYRIFASVNVWALCLMYALVGFAGNFFTNMMPLYLRDHRQLSGWTFTCVSALPLACGIGSCLLGGVLSDWIIRRFGSRKWGRRLNGAIGLVLAGLATVCIPFVHEVWLLALLLSAAFFCNDLNIGPAWAACADVGERYAGTVSGAMNMAGAFAGAAGTAFAGRMFQSERPQLLFTVFACSYGLAALCWLAVNVARPLVAPAPVLAKATKEPSGNGLVVAAGEV
jgi:ACS family glucarate transporter-like MFS transporter